MDPGSGASCPPLTAGNYWTSFSSSPSPLALASDQEYRSHWDPSLVSAALGYFSPPNVSGRPDLTKNMPAKGRERTYRYIYVVRPVKGSLDPGGLTAASWVMICGTSWGLHNRGSAVEGLRLMVG